MVVFGAVLLTMLTVAFIAYPLFRRRGGGVVKDERLSELYSNRDNTHSMLKELELEYRAGALSQEDYQELEARFKKKSIPVLKNIDNIKKGDGIEQRIEERVKELRQSRGRVQFCRQCGEKCHEGDRFCSACGANLGRGKA